LLVHILLSLSRHPRLICISLNTFYAQRFCEGHSMVFLAFLSDASRLSQIATSDLHVSRQAGLSYSDWDMFAR
jgi:hypothetical protein